MKSPTPPSSQHAPFHDEPAMPAYFPVSHVLAIENLKGLSGIEIEGHYEQQRGFHTRTNHESPEFTARRSRQVSRTTVRRPHSLRWRYNAQVARLTLIERDHANLNVGGAESLRHARSHELRAAGFEVIDLASGDRTVDLARQLKPEVILLSASPGEDSLSVVVRLKADATTRKITVVALVDPHTSDRDEAALYDAGIEISLRSPTSRVLIAAVRASVRNAQSQAELRHSLKQERIARHELAAAKRAIVESETLYREMSESFPYGVWMSDASGTPIFVSDSFLALTETTIEQARAGDWKKRIAAEDLNGYLDTWRRSIQTGNPGSTNIAFSDLTANIITSLAAAVRYSISEARL